MVQDDISEIIRDLREIHKNDTETASAVTIGEELKNDLESAANFAGSPLEQQAYLFCKRLGINYKNLSTKEFQQLVYILEKSRFWKTAGKQKRKKSR